MKNINEAVEAVKKANDKYQFPMYLSKSIQTLIDFVKRVESAEMPKKKEGIDLSLVNRNEYDIRDSCKDVGYNQAIDDCKLYIAKMNKDKVVMDVGKVEDVIKRTAGEYLINKSMRTLLAQSIVAHFTPPEEKGIKSSTAKELNGGKE